MKDATKNYFLPVLNFTCMVYDASAGEKIKELILALGGVIRDELYDSHKRQGPELFECREGTLVISSPAIWRADDSASIIEKLTRLHRVSQLELIRFKILTPDLTTFNLAQDALIEIGFWWASSGHTHISISDPGVHKWLVTDYDGSMLRTKFTEDYTSVPELKQKDLDYMLAYLNAEPIDINAIFANKSNFRIRRPAC